MRVVALFVLFVSVCVRGDLKKHSYDRHSRLEVKANKIWPESQPALSKKYSSLPFCKPKENKVKLSTNFQHSLTGERFEPVDHQIEFGVNTERSLCGQYELSREDVAKFIAAIEDKTHGELVIDNLPFDFIVGVKQQETPTSAPQYFLLSHIVISLVRQGEYVLGGNITYPVSQERPQTQLIAGEAAKVDFKYKVIWSQELSDEVQPADRANYHAILQGQSGGLVLRAHWFAIINTFLLALLLTAGFGYILGRTVRNDVTRYLSNHELLLEEDENDEIDDSGWKQVHGDVFRAPEYPSLFSACVGVGVQMFVVVCGIIVSVLLGLLQPGGDHRGDVYTSIMILYTLSSGLAGYVSCRLYTQLTNYATSTPPGPIRWSQNALLVCGLFAMPFLFVFAVVNSVAIHYEATSAIPALTIVQIIAGWLFVCFPVTVFGAKFGNMHATDNNPDYPCKITMVSRALPIDIPWYHQATSHMVIAGFLPFTAIFIELHTIFNAIWENQVYTLFGILAISFLLLYIVTSFATILVTYFQLTTEDHRWWWRSLMAGGSAGFFIFLYSIFFYFRRSTMAGGMQATMYFGYMSMISYAFFLMLGSVGFLSTFKFVRYIYGSIKQA